MNFIQKLFKSRKVDEPMNSALNIPVVIPRLSSDWIKFEDENHHTKLYQLLVILMIADGLWILFGGMKINNVG